MPSVLYTALEGSELALRPLTRISDHDRPRRDQGRQVLDVELLQQPEAE